MQNKIISQNSRIKNIRGIDVNMYDEMRELLDLIYHHIKLYDGYMISHDEQYAQTYKKGVRILCHLFNSEISERFSIKDKLDLIEEAEKLCLRLMQEVENEEIKKMCYDLLKMYGAYTHRLKDEDRSSPNTIIDKRNKV